jgi:hypothetical protein
LTYHFCVIAPAFDARLAFTPLRKFKGVPGPVTLKEIILTLGHVTERALALPIATTLRS